MDTKPKECVNEIDSNNEGKSSELWNSLARVVALVFTCFQLYTVVFGVLLPPIQRSIHLSFALVLAFIIYPRKRGGRQNRVDLFDLILIAMSCAIAVYWIIEYEGIMLRAGEVNSLDLVMGISALILVFEGTRRVLGYPMFLIAAVALLYCYFGNYAPSFMLHRGFSLRRIVAHMYMGTQGIYGIPIGVVSTFVFMFLLFGSFLSKTGVAQFFNDFANALTGRAAGGPAKVAVISSALQGTVSGSSVANVVASGSFTIPMMKKTGYTPEFAAAVEAAASTGGQIMPPIMGAAAFLMSEFTGIPYWNIALSAAIPALLYFSGVFFGVHIEAKKLGLEGLPENEVPNVFAVVKERGIMFLPIIVIVVILASGMTPMRAALAGVICAIAVGAIYKKSRLNIRDFLDAFEETANTAIGVAIVSSMAGIVVGCVTLTGLGLKLGGGLVDLARGNLMLTAMFSMISSIVLGMGVPTTANYVITSTIVAPALIQLGVPVIAAHLFVFYFGIVADITPPVCEAAFTGAAIAGGDPLKAGLNATKLAIGAFIVPYVFINSPELVLVNVNWYKLPVMIIGALLGMYSIASAAEGWFIDNLNIFERVLLVIGGIMLIQPSLTTDILGVIILVAFFVYKKLVAKKRSCINNSIKQM
ncbi:MAG: TRAP transporter permease [Firmicutes bacterium]|nr:TRAP transporter permease [Bacillota bacterium]